MTNTKLASLLFVSYFVLISSCAKKQEKKTQQALAPVSVKTYKVSKEEVTGKDVFPGTVVPLKEVQLRAQVSGYITNIYVKDGQKVKQGEKLYEIDRRKYQASYTQAMANIRNANANLQRAKQDLDRYERLLTKEAIARQQVEHARADYESAQSQLSAAEALRKSAETDLAYSIITAPFNGTIGISQVRVGAQVSPGQTLLNTLSADDPVAVDIVVSEKEIPRFMRLQQNGMNQPDDSTFIIKLADGTIYPYSAAIEAIDRAVDRRTGTITVRLSVPNEKRTLISGMTVTVQVLNQDVGEQVIIPFKAVTEQMGEYFVYVVNADSVMQRRIELGTRINEKVVVRKGLQSDETIVLEGIQRLRPGSKIQTGVSSQPQAAKP